MQRVIEFQSTPPRGVRLTVDLLCRDCQCFNPRPRAGCDKVGTDLRQYLTSFNPRPRAGCDIKTNTNKHKQSVSIHAPARGATYWIKCQEPFFIVSIHAPARGATKMQAEEQEAKRVSIHAPARGATIILSQYAEINQFQSTPPRGVRHGIEYGATTGYGFNPRPRAGCDLQSGRLKSFKIVSIHAPARGATFTSDSIMDS